jgi:hypothetical protein
MCVVKTRRGEQGRKEEEKAQEGVSIEQKVN